MDYSGHNNNLQWDPAYDRTLFVLFSGSNDYLMLADESCAQELLCVERNVH